MEYKLEEAIEVLKRTPLVLKELLLGISPAWIHGNEGAGTWSPIEVLGHLIINEETNFYSRVKLILSETETPRLSPIDMTAHLVRFRDVPCDQQLELFEKLRLENIASLRLLQISAHDLSKTGLHPKVGVVQLTHVLSTWVAHDLVHLVADHMRDG